MGGKPPKSVGWHPVGRHLACDFVWLTWNSDKDEKSRKRESKFWKAMWGGGITYKINVIGKHCQFVMNTCQFHATNVGPRSNIRSKGFKGYNEKKWGQWAALTCPLLYRKIRRFITHVFYLSQWLRIQFINTTQRVTQSPWRRAAFRYDQITVSNALWMSGRSNIKGWIWWRAVWTKRSIQQTLSVAC